MDSFTRASLEEDGFCGFVPLHTLDVEVVPPIPGVYAVVRRSVDPPAFRRENPGGRFKSLDPTVPISKLAAKWVEGCSVLYIGKAGSGKATLRSRIRQYRDFGQGKPVGHCGGRYIWQLADARDLLVCWKSTSANPRDEKKVLLARFQGCYGRLPFANLISG